MTVRNMLVQILCLGIAMMNHLTPSYAKALRSVQTVVPASTINNDAHFVFSGHHIDIKNTCNTNLKIHMRYYDGGLKYAVSDYVGSDQKVSVPMNDKNVNLVLVSAVTTDGRDIFLAKCLHGEAGYIRYDDGLCYRLYYNTEDGEIVCAADVDYPPSERSGLRRLGGVRSHVVEAVEL